MRSINVIILFLCRLQNCYYKRVFEQSSNRIIETSIESSSNRNIEIPNNRVIEFSNYRVFETSRIRIIEFTGIRLSESPVHQASAALAPCPSGCSSTGCRSLCSLPGSLRPVPASPVPRPPLGTGRGADAATWTLARIRCPRTGQR